LCYRGSSPNTALAKQLAESFTVYTYDRRGRGESGDTSPYAVEREVEDLEAVIEQAGGSADLYGISSGGALALEAANQLGGVKRLALYEVPFGLDDPRAPIPADFAAHLRDLIDRDRRGEAVAYFLKVVGTPAIVVGVMRLTPVWRKLKAVAHTLPYDAATLGETGPGKPVLGGRWTAIAAPTLVIGGGKSPPWMQNAMRALARALPHAQHRTLEGQTHLVKAKALAPVLAEFFDAQDDGGAAGPTHMGAQSQS
jgi:pimeloyl-ACP methyl ester carboxylesterase